MPKPSKDLKARYEDVRSRIDAAAAKAGRRGDDIVLVAVTKNASIDVVRQLLALGHQDFGENRVQESEAKWPALLEGAPDVRLHLVGPLQSNKVKRAVQLYHGIQTLDRLKLARPGS